MNPSWLIRKSEAHRKIRLFCFCYAGGNSSIFLSWQEKINPAIEICAIQLPGRGKRFLDPLINSIPELIAELAPVVSENSDLPFSFFGHSLGGLIAYELCHYLVERKLKQPSQLFVSGCDAPRYRSKDKNIHTLPHEEFVASLKKYNGTPSEIFSYPELLNTLLPTIRSDFFMAETYSYTSRNRLLLPINVFAGLQDDYDSPEQVTGWKEETSNACDIQWFKGDHFFINTATDQVIEQINRKLIKETFKSAFL